MTTPARLRMADLVAELRPGMTMYVPGVSGESLAFAEALKARPEAASGVRFVGVHFPGINRTDYLGLHPEARQRGYFMTPSLRAGLADGRAELVPADYPGAYRDLAEQVDVDLALIQVAPPDANGACSPGLSSDFHPAIWPRAKRRIAHINPSLPVTTGSFMPQLGDFDAVIEHAHPPVYFDTGSVDEAARRHAAHVASLVHDGDTLEFGIGKLPSAILQALVNHRRLRVWSGMVSPSVTALLDSGAIRGRGSIQAGVALGDADFYARVGQDRAFHFRPVNETHEVRRIARMRNFCAINSAVEVDLFGQANADTLRGKQVAGVGGLPAFAAGALLARGGRSIIALPAATDDGRHSRIVPRIGSGNLVALPRHVADYVVTEFGVAALRGLSVPQRARALIDIAAPDFRDTLAAEWDAIARGL